MLLRPDNPLSGPKYMVGSVDESGSPAGWFTKYRLQEIEPRRAGQYEGGLETLKFRELLVLKRSLRLPLERVQVLVLRFLDELCDGSGGRHPEGAWTTLTS